MSVNKNIWTPAAQAIFNLLNDLPVAYRANLSIALDGDPITALVLAQSFYFQCEAEGRGMSWWSKTDAEFSDRLGIAVKRFRRGMDVLTGEGMALLSHRSRRYQCTDYQVNWARCQAYIAGKAHLWLPAQFELPIPKMGNDQYPKWAMTNTQNGQSKEIKKEELNDVDDARVRERAISLERFFVEQNIENPTRNELVNGLSQFADGIEIAQEICERTTQQAVASTISGNNWMKSGTGMIVSRIRQEIVRRQQ